MVVQIRSIVKRRGTSSVNAARIKSSYGRIGRWTASVFVCVGVMVGVLVSRAGVPVVPAGIAGTFESWPRSRLIPIPYPVRIHYGRPITPEEIAGMRSEDVTALIRERIEESLVIARRGLASDLGCRGS